MKQSQDKSNTLKVLNILAILVLAGAAVFFFIKYQEAKDEIPKTQEEETASLVEQVSKIYELPTGETPSIATIQDVEALRDQAFFTNAQNGDRLLIYEQARQAFLYRDSTNKVINAGPIAVTQEVGDAVEQDQPASQPAPARASVLLYGSQSSIDAANNQIETLVGNADVSTEVDNENGLDPVIVVLNSDFSDLASSLSEQLNIGTDTALPSLYTGPTASIVVILE